MTLEGHPIRAHDMTDHRRPLTPVVLRQMQAAAGMSAEAFAHRLGTSRSAYYRWINAEARISPIVARGIRSIFEEVMVELEDVRENRREEIA